MSVSMQFQILHGKDDFTSDQFSLITAEVKKRQRILNFAVKNLEQAINHMQALVQLNNLPQLNNKHPSSKLIKKPTATVKTVKPKKVLKGQVSYKVKGQDGKLMNIAEIKKWVDSFYDGDQGVIKNE